MKTRQKSYGDKNLIRKNVEALRKARGILQKDFVAKLQVMGCDINLTGFSKSEGKNRCATDSEVFFIAKALGIPMEALFVNAENTGKA